MQSFEVPGRFPSLNDYLRIRNPRQRAALKRELDHRVAWAAKEAGVRPVKRFMVRVVWFEPNARRDWDNVRSGIKFVLDGLVAAGVIKDDSRKYVEQCPDRVLTDRARPRVVVEVSDE